MVVSVLVSAIRNGLSCQRSLPLKLVSHRLLKTVLHCLLEFSLTDEKYDLHSVINDKTLDFPKRFWESFLIKEK